MTTLVSSENVSVHFLKTKSTKDYIIKDSAWEYFTTSAKDMNIKHAEVGKHRVIIETTKSYEYILELEKWTHVKHPNIAQLVDAFGNINDGFHIIWEHPSSYTQMGELLTFDPWDTGVLWKFIYEAASSLDCLHRNNIIHQNISPPCFLMDNDGKILLYKWYCIQQKPEYQAPECSNALNESPTISSDIYSLGMAILGKFFSLDGILQIEMSELLHKTNSRDYDTIQRLFGQMYTNERMKLLDLLKILQYIDKELFILITQMTENIPTKRVLLNEVIQKAKSRNIAIHSSRYSTDNKYLIKKNNSGDLLNLDTPPWYIPEVDILYEERNFAVGSFGTAHYGVLRGKWNVVVKRLNSTNPNHPTMVYTGARNLVSESSVWHSLCHENLLRILGVCHTSIPALVVSEDAVFGNLTTFLSEHFNKPFTIKLLHEAALGLMYLHSRNIVHGDIKPTNILVGSDGKAKLSDYAWHYVDWLSGEHQQTSTLQYKAPELYLEGAKATFASDVYALGICILEAIIEVSLFKGMTVDEIQRYALHDEPLARPSAQNLHDDKWALIQAMTTKVPAQRMRLPQVLVTLKLYAIAEANQAKSRNQRYVPSFERIDSVAATGQLDLVKYFHGLRNARPCTTDAIDFAAKRGYFDIVHFLHTYRKEGCSSQAMDSAAEGGYLHIVEFLHVHRSEGCTSNAMDQAAANGHLSVVQFLHQNRQEGCTTSAMDLAAANGHLAVVRFLNEYRDEGYEDAMDWAAEAGQLKVLEYLHHNSPHGGMCSEWAMDKAAERGHLEIVKFLHKHRSEGCTTDAMDNAAKEGHLEIVKFLHLHRKEGCTSQALNLAAANGHFKVVQYLLEHRSEGNLVMAMRSAELRHFPKIVFYIDEVHQPSNLCLEKLSVPKSRKNVCDKCDQKYYHQTDTHSCGICGDWICLQCSSRKRISLPDSEQRVYICYQCLVSYRMRHAYDKVETKRLSPATSIKLSQINPDYSSSYPVCVESNESKNSHTKTGARASTIQNINKSREEWITRVYTHNR